MVILSFFLLLLALAYMVLLLFYRKAWKSIPSYHSSVQPNENFKISVIIPARDEAENLPFLLEDLKAQSLPENNFEVIVVDDHSSDNTPQVVLAAGRNIRLISLHEHITAPVKAYKKKALEIAISQAEGTLIVTTDADCRVKPGWLKTITDYFNSKTCELLVMPVVMDRTHSFFDIFQTLDFMSLQGITGAAVSRKWHYMGNGANLAYLKTTFKEVNGFEGIDNIASGDDMLLMEKFAKNNPRSIHYLKDPGVIVGTATSPTIRSFLAQRARWAGKAGHYKDSRITLVLLLVYMFNVSLLIMPLVAVIFRAPLAGSFSQFMLCWSAAVLIKIFSEMYFLRPVARFFSRVHLLKYFPLAQPFHILYTVLSGFLGLAGKQDWKGRKV